MRTCLLGIYAFEDENVVEKNTCNVCKVTHFDDRCVVSCHLVTSIIRKELCFAKEGKKAVCSQILEESLAKSIEFLSKYQSELQLDENVATKNREELLFYCAKERDLVDLELGERNTIGYTYKCLGSGIWAYLNKEAGQFKSILTTLIKEGGDSDTNAAVAGALLGCKIGYTNLPKEWLSGLLYKRYLDERVVAFLGKMGYKF